MSLRTRIAITAALAVAGGIAIASLGV